MTIHLPMKTDTDCNKKEFGHITMEWPPQNLKSKVARVMSKITKNLHVDHHMFAPYCVSESHVNKLVTLEHATRDSFEARVVMVAIQTS